MASQYNFSASKGQGAQGTSSPYKNRVSGSPLITGGFRMDRCHLSNASSASETSRYSDDTFFSNPSPSATDMSYSPTFEYDSTCDAPLPVPQYLPPSPTIQVPLADNVLDNIRWTPSSLWAGTDLLDLYKFVVQKGKEPFFQLVPHWTVTAQTPARVYLDYPRKVPRLFREVETS